MNLVHYVPFLEGEVYNSIDLNNASRYVGLPHLVQWKSQQYFAPEASDLVGR